MQNKYPSRFLEQAINEFAKLPGIGHKTALRLILYLLRRPAEDVIRLGESIVQLKSEIKQCRCCHNISDSDTCYICADSNRDHNIICVVENIRDVIAIENTRQYKGVFHVLGGLLSPMDGVGSKDIEIESLEQRVAETENIDEIILALSTTPEGDTTNFYIYKRLKKYDIKITTLARGLSIGDELEYADEVTLGKSLINRIIYESSFVQ